MLPFPVLSRPNFADLSSRFTLTLASSVGCSLLRGAKKVNSFGIKQIQPLFPKYPGCGVSTYLSSGINNIRQGFSGTRLRFSRVTSHQSQVTSHAPAPLFSYSCELPFLQAFYFHNDPHCPGVGAAFQEKNSWQNTKSAKTEVAV